MLLVLEGLAMTLTTANAADGRHVGPDSRPGVSAQLLDVKSVALLLGYRPRISIMDGLQSTIDWYKKRR